MRANLSPFTLLSVPALILAVALAGCGSNNSSNKSGTSTKNLGLKSAGVLSVCTDATYPPMEYVPPSNPNTIVGADADLAKALAKQIHLRANMINTSFDSIIPALQAKRCDIIMSSMSNTPAREKQVNFINYMVAEEAVIVKTRSSIHSNGYAGLCGTTVAVEKATTELDGLNQQNKSCSKKINILPYTADTDAFQAFYNGHADAYTGDLPVVLHYISDPQYKGKLRKAGNPVKLNEPYAIALRKSSGNLKSALTTALKTIENNGTYKKILNKWGVGTASLK